MPARQRFETGFPLYPRQIVLINRQVQPFKQDASGLHKPETQILVM